MYLTGAHQQNHLLNVIFLKKKGGYNTSSNPSPFPLVDKPSFVRASRSKKFANSSLNETMKLDKCMYGIFGRNIQHVVCRLFIGY
jgi:hypothetical protein